MSEDPVVVVVTFGIGAAVVLLFWYDSRLRYKFEQLQCRNAVAAARRRLHQLERNLDRIAAFYEKLEWGTFLWEPPWNLRRRSDHIESLKVKDIEKSNIAKIVRAIHYTERVERFLRKLRSDDVVRIVDAKCSEMGWYRDHAHLTKEEVDKAESRRANARLAIEEYLYRITVQQRRNS